MTSDWPEPRLQAFARALPWEYRLRNVSWDVSLARWRMEAATTAGSGCARAALLMEVGGAREDWCRTLATWALQTAPVAGWWVVGGTQEPWQAERIAAGLPAPIACLEELDVLSLDCDGAHWAFSARAGDLLHPSLAWILANAAAEESTGVCWDWVEYTESETRFELESRHRAPWRDMVQELRTDQRARAFALPVAAWTRFPSISAWQIRTGQAATVDSRIHVHPEPLAMYRRMDADAVICDPAHARDVAAIYWGEPFKADAARGALAPAAAAPSVSVGLMYRDRPALTIAAIRSVLSQRFDGALELVLVDNASTPETAAALEVVLDEARAVARINRLDAPGAFNHSAQAMQAAQAARGNVLLFLNNDARLLQADAIDRMARWARLPNIASVGAAVVDADGAVVGGGMRARRLPGAEFNSPVEEACGVDASCARQVIGNSFACAAVSAVAWRAMGGLDILRFPAGYNDVDYCLRAVSLGWTHVNLGDIQVHHHVGASRAKQDEIAQKTWLRMRYPWVSARAMQERSREVVNAGSPSLPRLATQAGNIREHARASVGDGPEIDVARARGFA